MADYVIEMNNITKIFGNFKANDNINLKVEKGEIHALLGENGAGKSTLMSVLFGLYQPEYGDIKINGKKVNIDNPNDANKLGIGMVHQHFKLVHNFTVVENIVLGLETVKKGRLEMDEAKKKIVELSEKYKLQINPDSLISDITVGMQQRVEILKMLYRDNNILIFDEPTAVLMPHEIQELMKIMKQLISEGKSIIFITHKLNEIKEVANRCTVLRKGKYIGTIDVGDTTKEEMSEMMVGRKVDFNIEKQKTKLGDTVLRVEKMSIKSIFSEKLIVKNVSFSVKAGEIVCVAGIDGNGQSELVFGITGMMPIKEGRIFLKEEEITDKSIRERYLKGISHIPEDRHKHGLVLDYTLQENLALQSYYKPEFEKFKFLNFKMMKKYALNLIEKFDIRCSNKEKSVVRGMSGGNQQKAIIARELSRDLEIVIAVQPTRGLDVGAIEFVHKQLIEQRDLGKAVLLISMELDEIMNVSDRILVIHEGEIVANKKPKEMTINELGLYMAGSKREEGVNNEKAN